MQQMPAINLHISQVKKVSTWLFILFCLPLLTQAQTTDEDSAQLLSKRLLDTITYSDPPPMQVAPEETYDEDDADEEEEKKEELFFLPLSSLPEDSFTIRHLDPATIKAQQQDKDFWYANYPFKKNNKREEEKPGTRPLIMEPAFQTFLWIVAVVGFVAFIIIFLSGSNVGLFRRNRYLQQEQTGEPNLDDIFAINFQQELDKAATAGNYRLGVRLLFLRLLRNMSDRHIIDYKQDRTNFDYLMQLQPTRYYKDFFRLARHYEYSWYGQFSIEQEKFGIIRTEFENFDRKLN